MKNSLKSMAIGVYIMLGILVLSGCGLLFADDDLFVNKYAEAHLTKNNELQFRFKINDDFLAGREMFKVKVKIHDERLAKALGSEEIIYGEEQVLDGEYVEVEEDGQNFILMEPIPLKVDLHISELEKMIAEENAVSIEIFNDEEVFGESYLNNFSSEI